MFERDYIVRILQNFFVDVAKLLRGKAPDDVLLKAFGDLYRNYLKNDRAHYYETSTGSLVTSFHNDPDGIYKAEILVTLLYHDSSLQKDETMQKELLEKCLEIYQYIDQQSKDFSLERKEMIKSIEVWLHR